jgi:thiamine biosynthesis lipoprotein
MTARVGSAIGRSAERGETHEGADRRSMAPITEPASVSAGDRRSMAPTTDPASVSAGSRRDMAPTTDPASVSAGSRRTMSAIAEQDSFSPRSRTTSESPASTSVASQAGAGASSPTTVDSHAAVDAHRAVAGTTAHRAVAGTTAHRAVAGTTAQPVVAPAATVGVSASRAGAPPTATLSAVAGPATGIEAAPPAPTPVDARWEAIGTSVHVLTTHSAALQPAIDAVRRVLRSADETYSRFRSDSELQRLTARPSSTTPVSPLLARAVEAALRAAWLTGGAVDPTVGRAMRVIGYDRDFAQLRGDGGPLELRIESAPGWHRVRLDVVARMLHIPRGVELDLGSTGKALAADLAAEAAIEAARERIAEQGDEFSSVGVLVNLGGDIATAGAAPDGGWKIALADDARQDPRTASEHVTILSGAIATSSTTVRRWTRAGVERHHIIDPTTGLPTTGPWRTVSVVAATCVDANAAATGAVVRGESAPAWLTQSGLPARLVSDDGRVMRVAGWPDPSTITGTAAAR